MARGQRCRLLPGFVLHCGIILPCLTHSHRARASHECKGKNRSSSDPWPSHVRRLNIGLPFPFIFFYYSRFPSKTSRMFYSEINHLSVFGAYDATSVSKQIQVLDKQIHGYFFETRGPGKGKVWISCPKLSHFRRICALLRVTPVDSGVS